MGFAIARSYLVLYNTVQAAGWATALYQGLLALGDVGGYRQVYEQSNTVVSRRVSVALWSCPMCDQINTVCALAGLFQLLSALEIVHAAAGMIFSL